MQFKRLLPENYSELEKYFKIQNHKLCYYSLSSLISWSHHIACPMWTVVDDSLVINITFPKKPDRNYLLMPISGERVYRPSELKELAESLGHKKFVNVPEDYLKLHEMDEIEQLFHVKELKRFEDYIFNTEDLSWLKGKKYSKKRNLINQFLKNHVDRGAVTIEPITPETVPECLELLETWCDTREFDYSSDYDASTEKQATVNALENIHRLGFSGILLKLDGKISAFGIGSRLTEEMGGFNFEKAVPDIKGLYQYFDMMCVRHLFKEYKYINKECDMGLPGLAQSKKSYYPVMTVKSYSLLLKTNNG